MCAGLDIIKIGLIIVAIIESHLLNPMRSLPVFRKNTVQRCWYSEDADIMLMCVSTYILSMLLGTLVGERGVQWMDCPALLKHACLPPPSAC